MHAFGRTVRAYECRALEASRLGAPERDGVARGFAPCRRASGSGTLDQVMTLAAASVAGQEVVWATGAIVLLLVVLTGPWAQALVTVAHEGGHMVAALLTGRGVRSFQVFSDGGGVTHVPDGSRGVGAVLIGLAGYLTPPLLGLGGAALVASGRPSAVLWSSLALLVASWLHYSGWLTGAIVTFAAAGIGYVAYAGDPALTAGVATALVWLLLIGGVWSLRGQGLGRRGSDAALLRGYTYVPGVVWVALFWAVAVFCLWSGGRALLGYAS